MAPLPLLQLVLLAHAQLAAAQWGPTYSCHVDMDCASVCPESTFNYVFCDFDADPDHGVCHFNDDGRGVPVEHHGQCPFGCAHASATCGQPLPGSNATCCASDFQDFGGRDGCWSHGCVPEGACGPSDPRCYGAFSQQNAFCNASVAAQAEPCGTGGGRTCDRRWDISNTVSEGEGFVARFQQCSEGQGSACGSLALKAGGVCELTFLLMRSQPGMGGGHIYLFAADPACGGGNYQFTDAAYGCGYTLQELEGSAWRTLATLCFAGGSEPEAAAITV